MQFHAASRKGGRPLNAGAAIVLGAMIGGIYLGVSTAALIDPFYSRGVAQARSSYTTDGWRGADAVPPPAPIVVAERFGQFVSDAYAAGHSYYELARSVAPPPEDPPAYEAETVSEPAPDMAAAADYQCIGCEPAPGDSARAPRESAADCHPDDGGCSSGSPAPDEQPGDADVIEPRVNPYF